MNNRPIGVFDSGIGGLTVAAEIMKQMPNENIIYFGDTARVPYGSKSEESVTKYSMQIANFLVEKKVKMIVVACNTASAFALDKLRGKLKIPVIGVIDPGAKAAVEITENGRLGVVGTTGTVNSASYKKAINKIDKSKKVFSMACPLFVPLVEEGWFDHEVTKKVCEEYLLPLRSKNIDTLILGCTHYPLLKKLIGKTLGSKVKLIDSATATAKAVGNILEQYNMLNKSSGNGKYVYFVSDSPEKFRRISKKFLGKMLTKVNKISVE